MGCGALIGAALGLAGAGTQEAANMSTKNEMNDIMAQQQAQQKQLQAKGQAVFQNSLGQSTPDAAAQQIAQGADQYKTAAQNAQAVPLGVAAAALTPQDKSANAARAALGNTAMANYAGYGQYSADQRLKDTQANSQLGFINNQSQYANSMLAPELGAAQNDFNNLRGVGSLLGTAGSLVGLGGSLGMFGQSPMAGLGNSATSLGTSSQASPLFMGQVAPQRQLAGWSNFGVGGI